MEARPSRIGNWTPDGEAEGARLRRDYLELDPAQRMKQVFELSRFMSKMAEGRVAASAVSELDIQGIIEELAAASVEYIVIGGVAVGFHGYVRATKDLDVVPAPDSQNLQRLAAVLRALEAELDGAGDFDAGELPDPLDPDVLGQGGNWVLQTRLGRFDLMQWQGESELWEMLSPSAVEVDLDGVAVKVASYEDLVALKRQAGRSSDIEDLDRLRQARGE